MSYIRSFGCSFLLLAFVAVVGAPSQSNAAAYIKFDGVDGEATDANHKEWIDVLSIDWGSRASGPPRSGRGTVSITKYVDKSSPNLMKSCSTGGRYKKVVISTSNTTSRQETYLQYELKDVRVTSCTSGTSGTSGDPVPTEQMTLNYAAIQWSYNKQDKKQGRGGASTSAYGPATSTTSAQVARMSKPDTRKARVQARPGPISPALQKMLESGDSSGAIAMCGASCGATGGKISVGGGGTAAPDCKDGNCSCNGVVDCVGMTDLCVPDTMGCNDYGCACQHNGNDP